MQNSSTITRVFETILSIPGMSENVKLQLTMPRKNVLLLSKVIERGLALKNHDEKENLLDVAPIETIDELKLVSDELLKKAGLTEMNEKLKSF